jgi:2-succinyl-5-enolpyruvyl-6-hydroxy-3-cyclohexene-1-carboxylate synthase
MSRPRDAGVRPVAERLGGVAVCLRAFAEELVRAGVRNAVVCPGSRSTGLALALAAHDGLRVRVLLDERSAAFFGIGLARATRCPVVLLATSGTAAAEFLPAVVEASMGRVPLVVLTADRPVELRDKGAAQTIDQTHLYGRHARWFSELPVLDEADATLAHVRWVAGRAVAVAAGAAGAPGPVHINAPFREPLVPVGALGPWPDMPGLPEDRAERPWAETVTGTRSLDAAQLTALATRLTGVERGLILAGPTDEPDLPPAIARLAAATGFPILADALSGLRCGRHDRSHVLVRADQLVRPGPWIAAHQPDLVIRFGAMPTSRPCLELLTTARPELIVVDSVAAWRDATMLPATFVHAEAATTADALANTMADALTAMAPLGAAMEGRGSTTPVRTTWLDDWLRADAAVDEALTRWRTTLGEPFEGAPFAAATGVLPDGALLWAGSSMPVRDLDGWLPSSERTIRVLSDRGANGIDGLLASALGAGAAGVGPVVLVLGDVSFLHDLNALVAARLHRLELTVVLINNDGGGIFSFLPQHATDAPQVGLPARFEELFGTPHGIDPGPLVEAFGFEHRTVDGRSFDVELARAINQPGVKVLELRTERGRNLEQHREAARIAATTLVRLAPPAAHHPAVLLLHGFTGSAADWAPFLPALGAVASCVAVDLLGHGDSDAPADPARHSLEHQAADMAALLVERGLAPATVVGYSLGARVALRMALDRPDAVRSLVLLSPSPGIADAQARAERREHDEALARQLEAEGVVAFVDAWQAQPLFAGEAALPAVTRAQVREARLRNDPVGLAASLRGAGQGSMAPLHEDLPRIGVPTLVVAGQRDAAGVERAQTIATAIPGSRLVVLDGVGHAVQREAPQAVEGLIVEHLSSLAATATRSRP